MQNEQFSPYQFLDAASLNAISSAVSGNIDSLAVALAGPGLLRPDLLVLTPSGLSLTATMPAPFGALFGNGVLAFANGSVPGQSSDTATISLAGLVPASGAAVTAYVYLTQSNVNEGPFQVTGPQPGHPDYNPNFAAYTAYAQNWDSLTLNASTSAPDGSTELLLCSTTLASGQSSLGTLLTGGQKLATPLPTQNFVNVTINKALAATDAGILQRLTTAVYLTLPDVSVASRIFPFACRSAGCFIQTASSGQLIYGFGGGASNIVQPVNGQAGAFVSDGVTWQTMFLSNGSGANPLAGTAAGLVVSNASGAINTTRNIVANSIILQDGQGNARAFSNVNLSYSTGNSGPSGIFQPLTPSSWLYEYVIYNASTNTLAAGADASATSPDLPSGFSFYGLVSADYVDGSSNLKQTIKRGKRNQYVVTPASNTASMPLIASGTTSPVGNPATAAPVGTFVPTVIAASILVTASNMGVDTVTCVAPNPNYGSEASTTNPPPLVNEASAFSLLLNLPIEMVLESTNIYWSSQGGGVFCFGWTDNF